NVNVADENPEIVEALKKRMDAWIEKRVKETGRPNPIDVNFLMNDRPFVSSQEAYDSKYIGGIADAVKLQKKG
ncbi:MAG: sulfatase, partial [Clostridia bacterium]|nr:sulfatase [Clostridia bacterium]